MRRPARDYRLALAAVGWVLLARAALALLPFRVARRVLDVKPRGASGALDPRRAAWAVHAVARRIPGTHCLARSLALNAMLRRAGLDSQVRIGVAGAPAGVLDAHAWVVCAGQVLADEDLGGYAPFG